MHPNLPAVEVSDLYFYYLTPVKRRVFPSLPLSRIVFEKNEALKHISAKFHEGRITALMGKNGSGKTTLIKLITGARYAQSGAIKVFGEPPEKMRHRFGMCLGSSLVYHRLSARENLEYFGQLYGVENLRSRIEELGEVMGLSNKLDNLVETYSFGMKAKLAIARAMIHSPDLLILDEPTLGIDFEVAQEIRKFIRSLKCTVILTTHYMEEVEALCDDLVVIDSGRVLAQGEKSQVLNRSNSKSVAQAYTTLIREHQQSHQEDQVEVSL